MVRRGMKMSESAAPRSANSALHLENVSRFYRMGAVEVRALCGIELDITNGEFVVILGPAVFDIYAFLSRMNL